MKKIIKWLLVSAFFCVPVLSHARIEMVKNGVAKSRIIVDKQNSNDLRAAELLQDFALRITGAKPEILPADTKSRKGDVLIGRFQLPVQGLNENAITEDGFYLSSNDGFIRIIPGEGKGSIYGVVTLLEDYFGIHYYAANTYSLNKSPQMTLPADIAKIDNPSFRFRQTQAYSMTDPIYRIWHRLESPNEVFADNLWVHTFNRLLPASEFGETHPEYYSFINGERRPGAASQWCLTNPEVFEIVSHRIDSIFKANPGSRIISVSQNDSQTHCYCDKCREIDEREGSPSGTIIYFLNKLAERFPDKEFSTLAYLYSVPPPKNLKPLPNVNIMLCDIDCHREVPLTENRSGRQFVDALEKWAAISDNIFVWDYGINFDSYVSPFPNFHILQPNMELFRKNKATMHFSQISSIKGGDFSEMRSYVVSKLLWNTSLNVDSLIWSFMEGYYGAPAAPYLYQYLKLLEGSLMGSNKSLWIYDTPVTHKDGMLNKTMMRRYNELFDKAEQAVADDQTFLDRVREARLPIMFSELEIARTEPVEDAPALKAKLNLFRERADAYKVSMLNERRNRVDEYCELYEQRNLAKREKSLAYSCPVEYIIHADEPYNRIENKALTDGLYGGATFNESWIGWEGKSAEFIIDLGEIKDISSVEADFLHKLGSWILLPKSMTCHVSTDKEHFASFGHIDIPEDRDVEVKYVPVPVKVQNPVKARYVKVNIETLGLCPSWHYGVGNPAWFFLDEINIY